MSCHAVVCMRIPAPRLTGRTGPLEDGYIVAGPVRSAAAAHPAIDPPIMPTLMPLASKPLDATREATAIRQRIGYMFAEEADERDQVHDHVYDGGLTAQARRRLTRGQRRDSRRGRRADLGVGDLVGEQGVGLGGFGGGVAARTA